MGHCGSRNAGWILPHTPMTKEKMGPTIRKRKRQLTVAFEDRTEYRHPNTDLHKSKNKNCQSANLFIFPVQGLMKKIGISFIRTDGRAGW